MLTVWLFHVQDVLLRKYGSDGKLIGHAAFGRPWASAFSAAADIDFGSTPKPEALLLADMTGDGRDDLVVMTSSQVQVRLGAVGSGGFGRGAWPPRGVHAAARKRTLLLRRHHTPHARRHR